MQKTIFITYVIGGFLAISPLFVVAATTLPGTSSPDASCTIMVRDLKVGMTGADVRLLQQVLNRSAKTQIAVSGGGSLGQETDFFGARTQSAVIKFQELYKEETLIPAGLSKGTGYFGKLSRAKFATLCGKTEMVGSPTPTPLTSPTPSPLPKMSERLTPISIGFGSVGSSSISETGTTTLSVPDNYAVIPGNSVHLYGSKFAANGNTVHLGESAIVTETSVNSVLGTLDFTVPLTAPTGKASVWVTNAKGQSNNIFLVIKSPDKMSPLISSVSPSTGKLGDTVTLTGTGFTPSENEIRFGDTVITNLSSSDGKTLTFTATSRVFAGGAHIGTSTPKIPFYIYVINAGGVSNAQLFTLTF